MSGPKVCDKPERERPEHQFEGAGQRLRVGPKRGVRDYGARPALSPIPFPQSSSGSNLKNLRVITAVRYRDLQEKIHIWSLR